MVLKLERQINFLELTIYGVGLILGAGIYALIGEAAGLAGNSVLLSFLVASLVASFTGLSYAELSSMYSRSAAEYFYSKEAFRSGLLSFIIVWLEIAGDVVGVSVVALAFGGYFQGLFGIPVTLSSIFLIIVLSVVNFWGIEESSRLNMLLTSIEFFGLLLIIWLGFGGLGTVNYLEFPHGFSGLFKAVGLVFFAYLGFEEMVNIGEEVENPTETIPKVIILSIILTTVLYILVSLSVVSLVNWQSLEGKPALAYAASQSFLGDTAFTLMSAIALFATANTVLIFLIVGSRMIYGASQDGSLPQIFSKIHRKTRTPWIAILTVMAVSSFFVLLTDITLVAEITDFILFLIFFTVNLSLIWLRYKRPQAETVQGSHEHRKIPSDTFSWLDFLCVDVIPL